MEKECGSKCLLTATLDHDTKRRLMQAMPGNSKFSDGQIHVQCKSCLDEMLADPMDQKFENLKIKLGKLGIKVN